MIYLDYSATTPVNKEVLDTFVKVSTDFIGNPNSLHKLGLESKKIIDASTNQIKKILNVDHEVIYTSGASESNNTVIKGIAVRYQNRGKHIITTKFEHSSIIAPLNYLQKQGFKVDFVNTLPNGLVDLDDLKRLITDDTILVTIGAVASEIGIRQPIEEIALLMKNYPNTFFHVDATQAIGKVSINLKDVDLVSFAAHKFYGLKGIGILLKKPNIDFEPLIQDAFDKMEKKAPEETGEVCPKCGRPLVIRKGRYGNFTACSGYPECKYVKVDPSTIKEICKCPNCDGMIVEKKSKRGKVFYGCNNYPSCKTAYWDKPTGELCPKCNKMLTEKNGKIKCSECDFEK